MPVSFIVVDILLSKLVAVFAMSEVSEIPAVIRHSSLGLRISHICSLVAKEKMVGIAALPIVAFVANKQSFWNRTDMECVAEAVREPISVRITWLVEDAVARMVQAGVPVPAFFWRALGQFAPKALFDRSLFCSHDLMLIWP
jgi:hypothetical protein